MVTTRRHIATNNLVTFKWLRTKEYSVKGYTFCLLLTRELTCRVMSINQLPRPFTMHILATTHMLSHTYAFRFYFDIPLSVHKSNKLIYLSRQFQNCILISYHTTHFLLMLSWLAIYVRLNKQASSMEPKSCIKCQYILEESTLTHRGRQRVVVRRDLDIHPVPKS